MSGVSLDFDQVRTTEPGPIYRIRTTITYAVKIQPQVFVFNTELDTFSHVSTVWDLENITPDKALAVSEGREYYRASACDVSYETTDAALEFVDYTASRIQSLVTDYDRATSSFEGTSHEHVVS